MKTQKKEVIEGILNGISWDSKGQIDQFSIYTEDGEDIILEFKTKPKAFLSHLNKHVKASGSISYSLDNCRTLRVDKLIGCPKIKKHSKNERKAS